LDVSAHHTTKLAATHSHIHIHTLSHPAYCHRYVNRNFYRHSYIHFHGYPDTVNRILRSSLDN